MDLDNPYNNGFVSVYPLIGIPASNDVEQHQGFAISLPLDKRHFLRDNTLNVNARLYSKNIVKISGVPMADYGMLYHGADAIKTLQQSGVWSEFDFLIDGFISANNNYMNPATSTFKRTREIELVFPEKVRLDVASLKKPKTFVDQEEEDNHLFVLPYKVLGVPNEFVLPGWAATSSAAGGAPLSVPSSGAHTDLSGMSHRILFYVARLDTASNKKNRQTYDLKPPTKSDMASGFGI